MTKSKSDWNGEDWLSRCAWCARVIDQGREVFALKAKLRPEALQTLEPGRIQPLFLEHSNKTVPIILPARGSAAQREGVEAAFQLCSGKCAHALQDALRQELSVAKVELFHPSDISAPPEDLSPQSFAAARRSLEHMMRQITRALEERDFKSAEEVNAFLESLPPDSEAFSAQPASPLEQAQDLVDQAWELPSRNRRARLARRALELSPDCADAYLLLASEEAKNPAQAKEFCEQALHAAERALGPEVFRAYAGHFWDALETRPYMRARAALAESLLATGDRAAALDHYRAMLDLNPGDNQGIRYILLDLLLAEGRDEEVGKLLQRYPDDAAATWVYDRALWLFRKEGPSRKAQKALRKALAHNPFIPAYLLREKKLPSAPPPFVGFGDENEAVDYVRGALANWHKTPHALDWLRENAPKGVGG